MSEQAVGSNAPNETARVEAFSDGVFATTSTRRYAMGARRTSTKNESPKDQTD